MISEYIVKLNKIMKILGFVLLYSVLIAIITYPLISFVLSGAQSDIIGQFNQPDLAGVLWYHWWFGYSLENGLDFFYNRYLSYPYGENAWLRVGGFSSFFFCYPVMKICGLVKGCNIMFFLILLMNCLSGFLLINELVKNKYLAFLGGGLICFNVFIFREISAGRLEQVSIFWIILYFWALIKLKKTKAKIYIFISALFFLMTSLTAWHYGVILCFVFLFWMISMLIEKQWKVFEFSLFSFLTAIILIAPVVFIFTANFNGAYNNSFSIGETSSIQFSLFRVMKEFSLDAGGFFFYAGRHIKIKISLVTFIFSFIFAVIYFWRKYNIFWLFVWVGAIIFSLGPILQFNQVSTGIYLPFYWLVKYIPFMGRFLWPYRFLVLFYLASIVIIVTVIKESKKRVFISVGCVLFIILELALYFQYIFPVKSSKIEVSSIYRELTQLPQGIVLKLPFYGYGSQNFLYYQTIHQKKMFNGLITMGHLELIPYAQRKFIERFDLSGVGWFIKDKEDVDFLKQLGFKYILIDENGWPSENAVKEIERIKEKFKEFFGEPDRYNPEEGLYLYILDN